METDEAARLSLPRATNTGPGFASLRQRESPGTQQKKDPGLGGSRKEGTSQHSARSGRDLRRDERPRKGTFEPTLKTNMNAVDESEITPPPPHPPLPRRMKNQRKYTAVYGARSNYRAEPQMEAKGVPQKSEGFVSK